MKGLRFTPSSFHLHVSQHVPSVAYILPLTTKGPKLNIIPMTVSLLWYQVLMVVGIQISTLNSLAPQ